MSELVEFSKRGAIGVITVTNPPVNALSVGVPDGIIAGVEASEADPGISAMVLIGDGRTFIAGADIKEFNKPRPPEAKSLLDVITRFEAATKPVIIAIHGTALGGGLECAMGGHYRCAVASARVGQPEVKIGIIPGAGGTQRLPRLVGIEKGLDMCVGGDPISAGAAHKLGLIDEIIEGDLLDGAVAYAERLVAEGAPLKRVRDDHSKVKGADAALFEAYGKKIARKARGYMAPWHCIDAVKAATELDFDAGIARERELFNECLASPQAKGLMYSFFAERAANKVSGISKETPVVKIERGGVIGAGTMGGGIAMNFANAGIPVRITDSTQEFLDKGVARIRSNYERSVKSGRFDMAEVDRRMGLIEPTLDLADFGDVDYVIEAVFEEMEVKRDMFRKLDAACKPGAILASNTSYLNIDEIAGETGRAHKVLGTHFFSPANVMRLLEIVRGAETDATTLATTIQLSKAMGKVGVVVGVCDGFVGNRMLSGYFRQANLLVLEGAAPQKVDQVIYDFGFAMGPFAVGDLAGLDIGWRSRKDRGLSNVESYARIPDQLCERGRFGQKTGAGWYLYEEGSRAPKPDPAVDAIIEATAAELGVTRRDIGDEEIIARCMYPLVNEGARILEEGFAERASDIDTIWLNGYGFPPYRGGPMFHADQVGLDKVLATIESFHANHGPDWEPAPLLRKLAAEGKGFGDL